MKPTITIKEVSAISLLTARNWRPPPRAALISITGTGEARVTLKKGWAHVLRLVFDDGEVPFFNRRIFSEADADAVIDFLDKIEGKVDHVVGHCRFGQAGLRRSRGTLASGTISRTGSATIARSTDTPSRPCSGDGGTVSRPEKGVVATWDPRPRTTRSTRWGP